VHACCSFLLGSAAPRARPNTDKRFVGLDQSLPLAPRQLRVRPDCLNHVRGLLLLARHASLFVESVRRHLQRTRDRPQHMLGRRAQTALDLRQIRIRDPDELGELARALA
jgi:hypothetical protein